jgi:thiosulfate/3-mercaptopyruvate sulfurtransferase
LIDLCKPERYNDGHIYGACHAPFTATQLGQPPAPGLLPAKKELEYLFTQLGHRAEAVYVVYDDEVGGWAGRFIWLLDIIGHPQHHLLNGGIHAWIGECHATTKVIPLPVQQPTVQLTLSDTPIATLDYVRSRLGNTDMVLWDVRETDEYKGKKVLCNKAGHIPGAINFDWTAAMDKDRHLRIRKDIAEVLLNLGITPDKEIITYCQTHHRSGLAYVIAKFLGYPRVKGYAGAWSEWGNHPDTPVEQ